MSPAASVLESSRREARFVAAVWVACCAYCVGYAGLFAYRRDPDPRLVLGIPEWVVWGVLAPWAVVLVLTTWYAFSRMRDEDLGEEQAGAADPEPAHG